MVDVAAPNSEAIGAIAVPIASQNRVGRFAIDDDGLIARSYITDDTGALARAVLEFLEGKEASDEPK